MLGPHCFWLQGIRGNQVLYIFIADSEKALIGAQTNNNYWPIKIRAIEWTILPKTYARVPYRSRPVLERSLAVILCLRNGLLDPELLLDHIL